MTNIKVEVNIDEINPGENLILTLADQYILDGDNINEEEDHLENPDIKEKDQLEFRKRQIDKIKKKNYSQKYEEYDNGQKANLLAHYDEDKLTKEGFYIDQDGQVANQKKKEIDLIQSKLSKQNNHQISLLYEDKIASDYKPYIPNTFIKKKIIKQNDEFPKEEQIPKVPKFDQNIEVDDYTLLQQSILNKQRKKQLKNEDKLRQIIQGNSEIEKQNKTTFDTQQIKLQPDAQEIREISSATDFLSSVKTEKEMEEINLRNTAPSNYSIKDTRAGTASILNVSLPTERLRNKQEKILIEEDEQQIQVLEPIKDEQVIQQLEEVLEEKQLGKGLADTLRLFKERGDLKQNNYDFQGRAKDEKVKNVNGDDDQVRLEYRDGSGRLMTQKEAFRYQCWKFHGEAPSKTKIEKRKKKDLLSQKQKRIQTGGLMKTLQENQKKSQNPYMIISKKKQLTE